MIENEVKAYIKARYKSIPAFAEEAGIKYQTLMGMFDRGLDNASIGNVMKLCRTLGISADALSLGKIVPIEERQYQDINTMINQFAVMLDNAAIDGKRISEQERQTIQDALAVTVEILRKRR